MILIAGKTALKWAYLEKMIAVNPCEGLLKYQHTPGKRGILTPTEAATIFKAPWAERRAAVGNLLAAVTGARAGEVLGLRENDIDPQKNIIHIRHSWSDLDGLKCPKNGKERRVPVPPMVKAELFALLRANPHEGENRYIFYSTLKDKPMDFHFLLDGLQAACKAAKIDIKGRAICFHSHRHYFSARMLDKTEAEKIMRVTGHNVKAVFDAYADHIEETNIQEMGEVAEGVFAGILPTGWTEEDEK